LTVYSGQYSTDGNTLFLTNITKADFTDTPDSLLDMNPDDLLASLSEPAADETRTFSMPGANTLIIDGMTLAKR